MHRESIPDGFLQYQLGKVAVNFLRTEMGFILAALVCASPAIAFWRVKPLYKWLAAACLASNTFLLIALAFLGAALHASMVCRETSH